MDSDTESITEGACTPETFKNSVKEYLAIQERLADIRKDAAMLNKRKKNLTNTILTFMKCHEKEFCNITNQGSLIMKTNKTKQALKKEDIEQLLQKYGHTEESSKDMAVYLWSNKREKETQVLKHCKNPL
tara:strand:- start:273 stop:662 length:390 start_codon:yes stop_codon:yes gene_type:complete